MRSQFLPCSQCEFNNNLFEINPEFNDKYSIPKTFKKHLSLKRGNILINEFYKKK